jgi:hypothetical protein
MIACTNVGWVLDFCNNRPLRVFENVQNLLRTTWSRHFEKNSEPKNQSLSGGLSRTFKEPPVLMKEMAKTQQLSRQLFHFGTLRTAVI